MTQQATKQNSYLERVATIACGVCPVCRHRTLECERHVVDERRKTFEGFQYVCTMDDCQFSKRVSDVSIIAASGLVDLDAPPGHVND